MPVRACCRGSNTFRILGLLGNWQCSGTWYIPVQYGRILIRRLCWYRTIAVLVEPITGLRDWYGTAAFFLNKKQEETLFPPLFIKMRQNSLATVG